MVSTVVGGIGIPPYYAALQNLTRPALRATATAVATSVYILVGQGLGPVAAGMLSDTLHADAGRNSLRLALIIMNCLIVWPAFHGYRAMALYPAAVRAVEPPAPG